MTKMLHFRGHIHNAASQMHSVEFRARSEPRHTTALCVCKPLRCISRARVCASSKSRINRRSTVFAEL